MPLLGHSGGDSDNLLDIAIIDEEISTIVSASRIQDRKNSTKYHDVDMTAWREKSREADDDVDMTAWRSKRRVEADNDDSCSVRSKETISTGCSFPRQQPRNMSSQASVYSECHSMKSMNSIRSMHTHDNTSQRSSRRAGTNNNSMHFLQQHDDASQRSSRKCRRDSRAGGSSFLEYSRRDSINSAINSVRTNDTGLTSTRSSKQDDSSQSEKDSSQGTNNRRRPQNNFRRDSVSSAMNNSVKTSDSMTNRSSMFDDSFHSARDHSCGTTDGGGRSNSSREQDIADDDLVALLEEKLAQISLHRAEIQSQVDNQKLKHRQLHLEFEDHQSFLRKLQRENIALRQENEDLHDSIPKPKTWYETSTSLLSSTTLSGAFSLSSKQSNGDHEELESTMAPQTLSTGSSSYFGMGTSKLFGYMYKDDEHQSKEVKPKDIITPKNITVTTKRATGTNNHHHDGQTQRKTLEQLAQQLEKQNEKQARKLKRRLKRRKKKFGLSQVTMGGKISTKNMDELDLSDCVETN